MTRCNLGFILVSISLILQGTVNAADPSRGEVEAVLKKSAQFFCEQVAVQGGYVWRYSADLSKREGEGKVDDTAGWVQPPGTPYVGTALIEFYNLTHDDYFLNAAHESAMALVRTQLQSGGWAARLEFAPDQRKRYAYRTDGEATQQARNVTTLDDDMTQSALQFLMQYDKTTEFNDKQVHEAVMYGFDSLIKAQFTNGGWPHVYETPADPNLYPVKNASYRQDDNHTRIEEHWRLYTLNDNLMSDVVDTLMLAYRTYKDERYLDAVKKAGDALILAQMPEPQPGWAQQYDLDMHPAWARKFEPASITGGEAQTVMMTLMDIYGLTGEKKYLDPIPKALAYYQRSLLPDGRLARFYELKTNKPLYFTKDYQLTYSDDDMPTHYGFKVGSNLPRIEKRFDALSAASWFPPDETQKKIPQPSPDTIRRIIQSMDERGAWIEEGRLRYWGDDDPTRRIINPTTFVRNAGALTQYLYHQR